MIKINLLEVEKVRRTKTATGGGTGGGSWTLLILLGVLLPAAVVFGVWYMLVSKDLDKLKAEVEQQRIRKKELEPYIKRVDELERRRNELLKKNTAIEELRSQRTLPVHILDEVSRATPEYLWMSNMKISSASVTIQGESLQEQAIPAFMNNLAASEFIGDSISLIETSKQQAQQGQNVTRFTISAPITNPFKPKPQPQKSLTETVTSK